MRIGKFEIILSDTFSVFSSAVFTLLCQGARMREKEKMLVVTGAVLQLEVIYSEFGFNI